MGRPKMSIADRLESKYCPEPNTGCWLWTGALNYSGYAFIGSFGVTLRAHRVSYELARGPIPDGLVLDHLCRVRCCINPDHLEPVTQDINVKRGALATQTVCQRGHEFTPQNTMIRRNGRRACRACHYASSRRTKLSA